MAKEGSPRALTGGWEREVTLVSVSPAHTPDQDLHRLQDGEGGLLLQPGPVASLGGGLGHSPRGHFDYPGASVPGSTIVKPAS